MDDILSRKHWIFDMDGTLTIGVHDFAMMRRELGLPDQAPILETLAQMPAEQAAPLWDKVNQLELHFASMATPMPGAKALLQNLHQQGAKLGIITRNMISAAEQTLAACELLDYFPPECILDRDSCAPKPSPAGLQQLMQHWQAQADDTVMVGDYLFDLQAGKAAGVATIHIDPKGIFPWPQYSDWQITGLEEIKPASLRKADLR